MDNFSRLSFFSVHENVAVARLWVASFCSQLNFTMTEVEEMKVAVSEGVSNAIIHGYKNDKSSLVDMELRIEDNTLTVIITDTGCGIEDIPKAMEPAFSTDIDRIGLGFVFMQSFTDFFSVESTPNRGTKLTLKRSPSC